MGHRRHLFLFCSFFPCTLLCAIFMLLAQRRCLIPREVEHACTRALFCCFLYFYELFASEGIDKKCSLFPSAVRCEKKKKGQGGAVTRGFRRLQFFPTLKLCVRRGVIVLAEICLKTKTTPELQSVQSNLCVLQRTKN